MKKKNRAARLALALLMSLCLTMTMMPSLAFAANDGDGTPGEEGTQYSGKTVVVYTGNLRGDLDAYAKVAAARDAYYEDGADEVYLVDAGNYLQGSRYANSSRGAVVYDLMDEAGYDVAAMGVYEFVFADATTGQKFHQNLTKYHTQAMLYDGIQETTYNKNMPGTSTATLAAREEPGFKVIASNLEGESAVSLGAAVQSIGAKEKLYSFDKNTVLDDGDLKIGFAAQTDSAVEGYLQDGDLTGLTFTENAALPEGADVIIGLSNDGKPVNGANETISAATDAEESMGALVIDNESKAITSEELDLSVEDTDVAAAVSAAKTQLEAADPKVATSSVMLNGKKSVNRAQESNLGDLVTDALLWYASEGTEDFHFDGFKKDVPVVAMQNGGNCYEYLYTGDVTVTDLFRSYPYSPMGVGIQYVTGKELLEALEEDNQTNPCNGFPQVAGMTYNLDVNEDFDASIVETYGSYQVADSFNRVSITSVGGQPFDPEATYAVIADNFVLNGGDTNYVFKKVRTEDSYINNGNGVLTRNIVEKYITEKLNGEIGEAYAQPQGRITFGDSDYKVAKAKADQAKADYEDAVKAGNAAKTAAAAAAYKKAAEELNKCAAITQNSDKISEAAAIAEEAGAADKSAQEAKVKSIKSVTVNAKTVNAAAIKKAIAAAGGSEAYVKQVVIGSKVKKISKGTFKKYPKVTAIQIKSKKLSKSSVKGAFKGSKVRTAKVNVGSKKVNKKYVKKYKKFFTKKNAGKAIKVK